MQILVLGINYVPEKTGIAPFTSGLCEHLVGAGNTVTMVTAFPYYPGWKVFDGYRGSRYRRETVNGVDVRRVWHFVPSRPSRLWQRLAHDLSFTMNAFWAGLFTGECDVIYCCCPPPTLGVAAYLLSKIKRAPFVIKLEDLASEAALATGIMRDGIGREKLLLISHWGDTERVRPLERSCRFRPAHNIPGDRFLVLHTGNMGKKQSLMNAIQAAELIGEEQKVEWLLVGDGEERPLLEQEAATRAPHQLRILPLQPVEILPHMYAEADLLLLNQKSTVEDAVIPSKLQTYMAAGRPIVAAVSARSESARYVHRASCGIVVEPEEPQALAEAVLRLAGDPELRKQLGANGRAYAEAHFTKSAVLEQYDVFFGQFDNGHSIAAAAP
jgi:colanic acid biosynthesis glycosyl transferase WcaI